MLLLNSRRLIYVHLNKCAGTAVEVSLSPLVKWNDILLGSTEQGEQLQPIYQSMFGLHKHSSAAEIERVIGDVWWQYHSFATVRSPYERTASLYGYVASLVEDELADAGFPMSGTIQQVRAWRAANASNLAPVWSFPAVMAYLDSRNAPKPFSEFLRNETLIVAEPAFGSQLSKLSIRSKPGLAVKEFIRTEQLKASWDAFLMRNNIPHQPLRAENATPARFKKNFAALTTDPADYTLIGSRFEADFEVFGYRRTQP
jgi:hypothetical protein